MEPIGSEIHFNEAEQKLGLPQRIPRRMALSIAHDLMRGAEVLQDDARYSEEAQKQLDWKKLGYESFESMLALRGWDVLSRDAFWRYELGHQLAELAGADIVQDVEAFLHTNRHDSD